MCRCRRQQMHIVETLFLNPFEKWVFYGRFPCKFVVHLILSVVVTAQAVIYFQRDIQHVSRTNQHFVHMFTSPDPLHSPYALQEGVAALITNHFLINNRSIVRYQLQHPDQMTLYLGYRNDERGEVKVNASQWISSEVLLRAAAELGVHYADTSDEFYWQRWMIDRYNQRAQDSGAKMVLSSGFCVLVLSSGFCVLAGDLGAQLALRDLSDVGGDLRLDAWLEGYNGGVSAGVIHTAEAMKKAKFPKEWETDPYVLAPNASAELRKDSKVEGMRYPSWVSGEGLMVSNIFGPYDARLLRRSFVHLKQAVTLRVGATSGMYPKWAAFIAEHPGSWSKLTQCPTDSVYKDGSWWYRFRAMAASGAASGGAASRVSQVLLSGHGDPGYHFTALGLAETGLCLAGKTPGCLKQNTPGGVYTPMSALEPDVLTARLESIDLLKVEKPKATVGVTQVII